MSVKQFLLIFVSFTFFSGAYAEPEKLSLTADEWKQGKKIFKRYCSKCHGKTAKGDGRMNKLYLKLRTNTPSNFTIGYYEKRPTKYLRKIITEGGEKHNRSKYMPPFKDELTSEQIDIMVKLIQFTGQEGMFPSSK